MITKVDNVPKDLDRILKRLVTCLSGYKGKDIDILNGVNFKQSISSDEVEIGLDFKFVRMKEIE